MTLGKDLRDIAILEMEERDRARPVKYPHAAGEVLPDRGDDLHWLRCVMCKKEWAEKDSGAFAKGSRYCNA